MLARDGQHSGVVTNAFENVTPWVASSAMARGIAPTMSHRWSSVTISTTFGCRGIGEGGNVVVGAGDAGPPPTPGRVPTTGPAATHADATTASATAAAARATIGTRATRDEFCRGRRCPLVRRSTPPHDGTAGTREQGFGGGGYFFRT